MKIMRFLSGGRVLLGQPIDERSAYRIDGAMLGAMKVTDQVVAVDKVLSPLTPADILCIGLNYREHANETISNLPVNPLLFIKAGNTLNHPGHPIPTPRRSSDIDFEGELVVVIGKDAKNIQRDRAMDYVFGFTIANDVTARDWQRDKALGGGQFARGKVLTGFVRWGR